MIKGSLRHPLPKAIEAIVGHERDGKPKTCRTTDEASDACTEQGVALPAPVHLKTCDGRASDNERVRNEIAPLYGDQPASVAV